MPEIKAEKLEFISATQSSTYYFSADNPGSAEKAIDGDLKRGTQHTECAYDTLITFTAGFSRVHCVKEVVVYPACINSPGPGCARRMDGTDVILMDGNDSFSCGTIYSTEDTVTGRAPHRINCNLKCGDRVRLEVSHTRNTADDPEACIHMKEIEAYGIGGYWVG